MRMISGLFVLITSASLAQLPAATVPTSSETCTTGDYAIYSAALPEVFAKPPEKLVLIDQTSTGVPPGVAAWTQSMSKAQPLLTEFPKEAREDYDARNKIHAKIEPDKIKASFAITLITPDEAVKLVEGGRWVNFKDTYQSRAITLVSRPGLDSDRTHALLYAGISYGRMCGGGVLIFLTKENGQWKVSNKVEIWMS